MKRNSVSQALRRVVILGTGGTIAGSSSDAGANVGYVAGTVPVGDLVKHLDLPEGYELHAEQIAQLDSKDLDFETWHALIQRAVHWLEQDDVAALIVTHGTDTIEETAFLLHSVLDSSKPTVLTCAMRPATSSSPDGPQNLRDALTVATAAQASGVVVVCAGEVHGAVDVRKQHPYRLNAFDSGDAGPIAYVEEGRVRLVRSWPANRSTHRGTDPRCLPPPAQWPRVEIVLSHAGARGHLIDALVREREASTPNAVAGIVLGATGNATLHREIEQAALRARDSGVEVRVATRCAEGQVIPTPSALFDVALGLSPVKARIDLLLDLMVSTGRFAMVPS